MGCEVGVGRQGAVVERPKKSKPRLAREQYSAALVPGDVERRREAERDHLEIPAGEYDVVVVVVAFAERGAQRPLMAARAVVPGAAPPPGQVLGNKRRLMTPEQRDADGQRTTGPNQSIKLHRIVPGKQRMGEAASSGDGSRWWEIGCLIHAFERQSTERLAFSNNSPGSACASVCTRRQRAQRLHARQRRLGSQKPGFSEKPGFFN